MTILGVDPGIARCGWGIIEVKRSNLKVQNFGCVETKSNASIEKRLMTIHEEITGLIEEHNPDAIAVEDLFFNTNSKTAFVVGQARGVILLAGAEKNIPVSIYTPLEVKMAITGYGRAEKNQMGKMVKTLLKLKEIPKPDDVTDALAVALTHAFTAKFKSNL